MQRCHPLPLAALAVLMIVAAGCGSSSPTASSATQTSRANSTATASTQKSDTTAQKSDTTAQKSDTTATKAATEPPPTAHLTLSSPAFQAGRSLGPEEHALAARYTCDGSNASPPISWSGVPAGTAELVLLAIGPIPSAKRPFAWAVGGLSPSLHRLSAGRLPSGAVAGRTSRGSTGYYVCPPRGRVYTYAIFLYALRHKLSLKPGFDPNALYEKIGSADLPQGQSGFAYKRS